MRVIVTGHAGFIGFHTSSKLLERGDDVLGIDNLNDYYDVSLKKKRLELLTGLAAQKGRIFQSEIVDLTDGATIKRLFAEFKPDRVIHLAAQAGVRHSISHPEDYVSSNLIGFANILEACRHSNAPHLTYASTSSVYGANTKLPFSEDDSVDHPLQFYAATKKANELMAHSYSNLFKLPTTGLRFFTVYGPWGRPDMALFLFTKNILAGEPIQVFNNGNHSRDFTYVGDIVEGIVRSSDDIAQADPNWNSDAPTPATSSAPYRIFNIGNRNPTPLIDYVKAIEKALGKQAIIEMKPLQPGDVPHTTADVSRLFNATGYKPSTTVEEGVAAFVEWYTEYYKSN